MFRKITRLSKSVLYSQGWLCDGREMRGDELELVMGCSGPQMTCNL